MGKKYISAGAGSGKTYRITTDVAKLINQGVLNPEQVIMTTYTKAAAQELREKAKKEVAAYDKDKSLLMEHALIGTVHSVANTFLTKYWYLLGILPDAAAMEEDEMKLYRDNSLRELLTSDERKFLYAFAEKYDCGYSYKDQKSGLNYEFWKDDLCNVLNYIQWYDITDEQLGNSLNLTKTFIDCLQPVPNLESYAKRAVDDAQSVLAGMRNGAKRNDQLAFIESLGSIFTPAELSMLNDIVKERCPKTPAGEDFLYAYFTNKYFADDVKHDLRQYAEMIFTLAMRWIVQYKTYKDEHHLIDFNDMEEKFLELLDMPEVQNDIRSRYTHLYVDEFQDSNPIQVKIFEKLSSLLNTTYVGDKKQAIYGFRGSDTELTAAVADGFDPSEKETLKHSWRSVKPLVDFSNKIFVKAFSEMDRAEVELGMPDPPDGNTTPVEKPLRLWSWEKENNLALQIQQFILHEKIAPKDIAVLAKKNSDLDKLATELQTLGVPVCREFSEIKDSRTGQLMKALLTLVAAPDSQAARAEVAFLTTPDYDLSKLINERLENLTLPDNRKLYLADNPMINKLMALLRYKKDESEKYTRNLLGYQSISALVETLVVELDLYAVVRSWENAKSEESNLQQFINIARKYEDRAAKMAQPATAAGFIAYFTERSQKGAANEDGVRLYTYHKSKGLEWKVVILLSIDDNPLDEKNLATGSMMGCHCHRKKTPSAANLYPPMSISLVRNIFGTSDVAKAALVKAMKSHGKWNEVMARAKGEAKRLLYVGVTRARDILVLAPKEGQLEWFQSIGIYPKALSGEPQQDVFSNGMMFDVSTCPTYVVMEWPKDECGKVHDLSRSLSDLSNPRYLSPSKVERKEHAIEPINDIDHRFAVKITKEEEAPMGDFIHQVFCCADEGITVSKIQELRDSYGFSSDNIAYTELPKLLDSWQFLTNTLEKTYGPAVCRHHERPFRHHDAEGHILNGYIDFIWETAEGCVIVDYKTYAGGYNDVFTPGGKHFAGNHGEQLDCYDRALTAEGKTVIARVIYYPVTSYAVAVK